jgi:hypothetical protein
MASTRRPPPARMFHATIRIAVERAEARGPVGPLEEAQAFRHGKADDE